MLSDRKYGLTVTLLATRSFVIIIITIIITIIMIIFIFIMIISKTVIVIIIRVLPVLIPQSVNPQLAIDQYLIVQNTIQEMFDHIDRCLMMMMMMMLLVVMMMISSR